jgi:hypothetical protein
MCMVSIYNSTLLMSLCVALSIIFTQFNPRSMGCNPMWWSKFVDIVCFISTCIEIFWSWLVQMGNGGGSNVHGSFA